MTVYKLAELPKWVRKCERITDAVVAQATNDLIVRASRTKPGIMRGGTVVAGYVPRHTGFLAASLVSSLNGSTFLTGPNSYEMVVAEMKAGDRAQFGWTAAYARAVHYSGWLWVDSAANDWSDIVADVAKRVKAIIQ